MHGVGIRACALLQYQPARGVWTAAADAGVPGLLIGAQTVSFVMAGQERNRFALDDPAIRAPIVSTLQDVMQAKA